MGGMYLIPSHMEKLPESEIFEYYQFDPPSESSYSQEIQLWNETGVTKKTFKQCKCRKIEFCFTTCQNRIS